MNRDVRTLHEAFVRRVLRLNRHTPNWRGHELYRLMKEVDGRPEATGTFPLFGARTTKLRYLCDGGWLFYEPLGSYDDLLRSVTENYRLLEGGAPRWAMNSVTVSVRVFESVYDAPAGVVPLPHPGETEQGVHNVNVDGGWTSGGEALRFRNSWGKEWGDEGYGMLSNEYLEHYMVEAWLARDASVGPSRFTRPLFLNTEDPRFYAKAWMLTDGRKWTLRVPKEGEDARCNVAGCYPDVHETLSVSGDDIEMAELRDDSGVPVGWSHVRHLASTKPPISIVEELFVWPWVRRQGYGSVLERCVAERARKRGSQKLRVLFHEADDFPGNTAAAKAFAVGTGYGWVWVFRQRPNVSALAEKIL